MMNFDELQSDAKRARTSYDDRGGGDSSHCGLHFVTGHRFGFGPKAGEYQPRVGVPFSEAISL